MRSITWWLCLVAVVVGLVAILGSPVVSAQEPATAQPRLRANAVSETRMLFPSPAVEKLFWRAMRVLRCAYWALIVCHLLLALWIAMDIRQRKQGNYLFVVLAIIAGFPATVVYTLVRIGDIKKG
jgi:hypothetical protein